MIGNQMIGIFLLSKYSWIYSIFDQINLDLKWAGKPMLWTDSHTKQGFAIPLYNNNKYISFSIKYDICFGHGVGDK